MDYFHLSVMPFFFLGGGGGGRRGRRKNNAKYGEMLRVGLSPLRWKRPQNSALKMKKVLK